MIYGHWKLMLQANTRWSQRIDSLWSQEIQNHTRGVNFSTSGCLTVLPGYYNFQGQQALHSGYGIFNTTGMKRSVVRHWVWYLHTCGVNFLTTVNSSGMQVIRPADFTPVVWNIHNYDLHFVYGSWVWWLHTCGGNFSTTVSFSGFCVGNFVLGYVGFTPVVRVVSQP